MMNGSAPTIDLKTQQAIDIARFIEANADQPITLISLSKHFNNTPANLRRNFLACFGMTPKRFHDGIRRGLFKAALKRGENVTDAAYLAGFNSLSRIHGSTPHSIGMKPSQYAKGAEQEQISFAFGQTPLGLVLMAATDQGVCFAEFGHSEDHLLKQLHKEFPLGMLNQTSQHPQLPLWLAALTDYLSNNKPLPEIPLDLKGTALQTQVWEFLTTIPTGETCSYQTLAKKLGRPKAFRAVANACGKNRIAILVPCHRVLRSDGSLGGYRWGLERKQQLLDTESKTRVE